MDASFAALVAHLRLTPGQLATLQVIEDTYLGRVFTGDGPIADGDWVVGQLAIDLGDSAQTRKLVQALKAEGRRREREALNRLRHDREPPRLQLGTSSWRHVTTDVTGRTVAIPVPRPLFPDTDGGRLHQALASQGYFGMCDDCGAKIRRLNEEPKHHPACRYLPAPTSRTEVQWRRDRPPERRRLPGRQPLVDTSGVEYRDVPGVGYTEATHMGIAVRHTSIGGIPHQPMSPGRQPARNMVGMPVTSAGGTPMQPHPFG